MSNMHWGFKRDIREEFHQVIMIAVQFVDAYNFQFTTQHSLL